MAIVLASTGKNRRRALQIALGSAVVLVLAGGLAWMIFQWQQAPQPVSLPSSSTAAGIPINFGVLDSSQIKNLVPLTPPPMVFSYTATNAAGKTVSGQVSAPDQQTAQQMIQSQKLTVISLQSAQTGRTQPFTSYY